MRSGDGAQGGRMLDRPPQSAQVQPLLPGLVCRIAIAGLLLPSSAAASGLLAGAAGSADAAAAGATVAEPISAIQAQFANPAGLAAFEQRQMGLGLGLAYGQGEITGDNGYHADNEVLVHFAETFITVPRGDWTFGVSTLGTSGARFDYGPRPDVGIYDGFFSESGMMGIPIGAGWRATDRIWLGAQIIPLYASSHVRYSREVGEFPGELTKFRFTTSGFGVQGMFGATWKPDDAWAVGASVKPPGRVWTSGDTPLGSGKQDVDLEIEAPLEVAAGVTRTFATNWKASYGFRFMDTSVLAKSFFRFDDTPSADIAYLHGARDEWRHALGISYQWSERLMLLGGFSKANGIISSKGANPSSFDSKDVRLSTGLSWRGESWTFDGAFTYLFEGSRRVHPDEALVLPGRYESKPAYILSVTITKAL